MLTLSPVSDQSNSKDVVLKAIDEEIASWFHDHTELLRKELEARPLRQLEDCKFENHGYIDVFKTDLGCKKLKRLEENYRLFNSHQGRQLQATMHRFGTTTHAMLL